MNDVPGTKNVLRDVDSFIDSNGDLKEYYEIDALILSIRKLLTIVRGTYPFDPELGVGLHRYLFELATEELRANIQSDVYNAIKNFEPRCEVNVKVLFFNNKQGFLIELYLKYKGQEKKTNIEFDNRLLRNVN